MKLKILSIFGLLFLTLNQILLLKGDDFIQNQQPIDFAHWLLLIGAVLSLSLNSIFSKHSFSNVATILTLIGAVALIGQATIDFVWWTFGTDYDGLVYLINQLKGKPSVWLSFMTIGPAMFYTGLAIHAAKVIRTNPAASIAVILATIVIGFGSLVWPERIVIVSGHILLTIGLVLLIIRKRKTLHDKELSQD